MASTATQNAAAPPPATAPSPFVDESAMTQERPFPLKPDKLIALAKEVLVAGVHKSDKLAPEFVFSGRGSKGGGGGAADV